jgi:CRISPR-associated endoribonuclease Cas6
MRIYIKLTKTDEVIPYNYQSFLTGAIHKWIGEENQEHGKISLYSFSWLQNVETDKKGIKTKDGSFFFISTYHDDLIKKLIQGIRKNPNVCFGIKVSDIMIKETPEFTSPCRFEAASPIFVRRLIDGKDHHISYDDKMASEYLTETIQRKLSIAGLPCEGIKIRFDDSYPSPRTKIIKYKDISNRVNICPIIVEGTPEQLAFIHDAGAGNSTGVGFGALK